jgi:phosphatidylserine/phosphatidylglycerophosphate/cardiolipin synthase-like enzyme
VRDDVAPVGPHAVQVLRTYPARRAAYPFAPNGERSIARAYLKVFGQAKRLIYLEDQYLWSFHAAAALADALRREPELLLVIVIPRYPDPDGRLAGAASRFGRERVQDELFRAGGDRVAIYDVENAAALPVYVHSKACIVDDVWMAIGSDNLNRRSWTHDSEISCAILDSTRDDREPRDITGCGIGARRLPRDTRIRLAHEHTGGLLHPNAFVDPQEWFDQLRQSAAAVDEWHRAGAHGPRPPGHLRVHCPDRVDSPDHGPVQWVHTHVLDPDGRPRPLRHRNRY